jgi:ribosome-binding factor A
MVNLMATRRQRRVAELIHRELSLLLMREVRDPRLVDVTITEVRVTPDLLIARIYFTVLGDSGRDREALAALEHASGFLRTQLAGQVRLRFAPELVFEPDTSAAYGRRIDELLAQVAESDGPGDGSEPA